MLFSLLKQSGKKLLQLRYFGWNLLFWCTLFFSGTLILIIGICVGAWFWINQDLPRIERLADYRPPTVTQILTHDRQLIAEFYRERRYLIPLNKIPLHVINAFIAAEDGDFFNHPGIDFLGIIRAAITNFKAGKVVQGGSTITQQLAKTLLLTPQRTFVRKIKEMILAWHIEHYLTKNEILYLYLNQIYLGHGSYGIEAAALTFFGKHAQDLDIAEAAILAGLVQAPSRYSPLRYSSRTRARQVYVLDRLISNKKITSNEAEIALNKQLNLVLHRPDTVPANYYEEIIRQWLEDHFGTTVVYEGGLTVITACDETMTREGLKAIENGLNQLDQRHKKSLGSVITNELHQTIHHHLPEKAPIKKGSIYTAIITEFNPITKSIILCIGTEQGYLILPKFSQKRFNINKTGNYSFQPGDILQVCAIAKDITTKKWIFNLAEEPLTQSAMVVLENGSNRVRVLIGGRNFQQSQYNRALQARRSPGSSFKPFIYAAALDRTENPYTAASILIDTPIVYNDNSQPDDKWQPKNYDGLFNGPITLRQSLEQSRNVPTVKLLEDIGIKYTMDYIRRFGFESELTPTLSLALGASGVSLLELTKGYSVFANQGLLINPILIEQILDYEGKTIYQANIESRQAITPQTAFIITNILKGVLENGTGRGLQISNQVLAGKTGTTNELRDAWFVGFSPHLTCGVWVGYDDNESLGHKETGSRAAGPIWKEFMQKALTKYPSTNFIQPDGIIFARLEKETGQSSLNGFFFEAFKEGTYPNADIHTNDSRIQQSPLPSRPYLSESTSSQIFLEEEAFR